MKRIPWLAGRFPSRTPAWYIIHAHLIMALCGLVYMPVNLMAIIIQGERYDPSVLWVRVGDTIVRLHACLWRGMLAGFLIFVVSFYPTYIVASIVYRLQKRNAEKLFGKLDWNCCVAGFFCMWLIATIRFFQFPLPELFMHNFYLTEIWLELTDYPKPNLLSAFVAIIIQLEVARDLLDE